MNDIVRVSIVSRDRPCWVIAVGDSALESASARARSVERGERAVVSAHEAVVHIALVKVVSRDRARWVVREGDGTLEGVGGSASARSVERGERAVGSAHEAVIHIALVKAGSTDRSRLVDA